MRSVMPSIKKSLVYKICIVGDGGVGKTSLVLRYTDNSFKEDYLMTIGSNFAVKTMELPESPACTISLQIWDLAGQPRFNIVRPLFYRGAKAIIYVFDLTRKDSLENLINWKKEIEQNIELKPCILVGNKLDLAEKVKNKVEIEKVEILKSKLNAKSYLETSAKDGSNINEAFKECINGILNMTLIH